jgi:hypothetical protein
MSTYYEIVKNKTIDEVRKIKESDLNTKEKKYKLYQLNKLYKMLKSYNYDHGSSVNYEIPSDKTTIQMPVNYGQNVSLPSDHIKELVTDEPLKENIETYFQPDVQLSAQSQLGESQLEESHSDIQKQLDNQSDEVIDVVPDSIESNITKQLTKYQNEIEEILRPSNVMRSIGNVIKPIALSVLKNNARTFGTSSYISSSFDQNGNRIIENRQVHNHNGEVQNKHTRTTIDQHGNKIIEDLSNDNYIDVD